MCSTPVSQLTTPNTPAGFISTLTVGILPPARVLAEDLTKATLREGSPNLFQMAWKCVSKKLQVSQQIPTVQVNELELRTIKHQSLKPRVLTVHSSAPGCSGSAAGGSGQDPNELRQEVSHLALVISDDDEFTDDPHQIIPTEDTFALPFLPRLNLKGFDWVTFLHLPGISLWIVKNT